MQGKNKVYFRNTEKKIEKLITEKKSALLFGPRQTGKTTLIKKILKNNPNTLNYPLQNPQIRSELERDPSRLIKQILSYPQKQYVFIDEAQKVPTLFDAAQYLIDENKANFIITGSSARKLRRKGANLLPGRVKFFHLDPLLWNELGWTKQQTIEEFNIDNKNDIPNYDFEKSLVFGSLPGIVALDNDIERQEILKAYTHIYLEEEIRAEALSRKIGSFSRFLELAAQESGTNPNFAKLSMETGVSAPTIKEFYNLLEDTLIIERIDPYLKNARKRILLSSRYYIFDLGVRNALARVPLAKELINTDKGKLFEHAVVLEIIRRIRSLNLNFQVYYWRTASGAEVDCVIDTGSQVIPIEIKSSTSISVGKLKGLNSFLDEYQKLAPKGFVITNSRVPEQLTDKITAIPWQYF